MTLSPAHTLQSFDKYWRTFLISWQNAFVYRASLFFWRLRQFLSTLMSLTVWSVIFASSSNAFGYGREGMITYIFLVSILQGVILATALNGLGRIVYSGELSMYLVKPMHPFAYFGMQDLADKSKNAIFAALEGVLLYALFQPEVVIPSLSSLLWFGLFVIGGVILFFEITLLFGTIGFWSPDTWGPRFLFFMILDFTAGKLFPLDILPQLLQRILYFTPFPYFSYLQIQVFLERLSPAQLWQSGLALLAWIVIFGAITHWVWQRGMQDYSAAGQ
jgi:ABC-2 type transport system permease protein